MPEGATVCSAAQGAACELAHCSESNSCKGSRYAVLIYLSQEALCSLRSITPKAVTKLAVHQSLHYLTMDSGFSTRRLIQRLLSRRAADLDTFQRGLIIHVTRLRNHIAAFPNVLALDAASLA